MATPLEPGTIAPDFTLPDKNGNPVKLSDFRGKNVMIAFYPADWSDVCSNQLGVYGERLDELRGYNADVLGISVDGRESHNAWAEVMAIRFPLLSDFWPHGAVAQQYGVFWDHVGISNRALFFVDPDGIIRHTWVGEHPGMQPEYAFVIDTLKRMQGTGVRGSGIGG